MLRLVSSARSRLLRAGSVRVATVAVAPRAPRLAACTDRFYRLCELPRFFSSNAEGHDRPQWKNLALNNSAAWQEAVKPSLLTFFKLKKHLMVPIKFVVPQGDEGWPRAAWGYPLGKHAEWLRKQWRDRGCSIDPTQREELDEMGFAWDWTQYKWDRFILPSLRRFYELKGHTDVPAKFRVPRGSPDWPQHLWDLYLGNKVNNMLRRGDFVEQLKADQDELGRLNFDVGLALSNHKRREKVVATAHKASPDMELGAIRNDRESKWSERIMPAFETFHRLHGHCRVPTRFVVPSDECWPRLFWGLKLGTLVDNIRTRGSYSTQISRDKTRLVEMGFVWDFYESEWNDRIMPALETFRRLNGHCLVPRKYAVPSTEDWPRLSWGLNLGHIVRSIRQGCYFTQVARSKTHLDELGFVWDFLQSDWSERIMPALKAFYRVHGHCRVPSAFEVPAKAAWPEKFHGAKLGLAVQNMRSRGSYFDQIAREMELLEAIGFDMKTPITKKWEQRVEPMLATFEQLHGHRDVPRDFVVPSRSPWDEKDWGIQLGKLERKEPLRRQE